MQSRRDLLMAGGGVAAALSWPGGPARSQSRGDPLAITATGVMNTPNPYAHSAAHLYAIWGNVYGHLGRYNYITSAYEGVLAKEWRLVDDRRWRFTLRDDLKRHDGGPGPTTRDVVHSWQRVLTDPASLQRFYMTEIAAFEPVDALTFDVVTKRPVAQLLSYFFDRFVITSAELFEKHGAAADREAPLGWGPYRLTGFEIDQRVVVKKSPVWPGAASLPETVVYRLMQDPEQRVTALANSEVQIARMIPPQLVDRLKNRPDIKVVETGSLEFMFLAMNASFKPWGDVRVRRAVAHAINKDLIINRLLFGLADRMDAGVSRYQKCFGPVAQPLAYDPGKARALLKEAYPDGVEIDFFTANGRYVSDRQIGEALAQMLRQVGFKVNLHAPDYTQFTTDIQAGRCPMYYTGRGATVDPVEPLSSYWETGVSRRTNYSSPTLDGTFAKARSAFDDAGQCAAVSDLNRDFIDEVPAVFLWTHKMVHGVRANVTWPADPVGEPWLPDIRVA